MASHVFLHVLDDELRVYRYISLGGYHPYSDMYIMSDLCLILTIG